ncbi:ATP-binding cassette domain-containing protein [Pseudenhygromyxa sp. WMMC2535]|uniref:ABC transporter ATP-binding protein n=1 Tax=Pseudenhygromyxa sp. WMMC2535 TaxID=2712867 RepID=UPI0015523E9D|nr:ATP-binding cassette domain-containing protein [Pseudenhygromyxa sp. WMMC2535]NVB42945.1 ATP-binding cassette domain-containing protein [Pseudenhygromyxa sp. WMMC2535]
MSGTQERQPTRGDALEGDTERAPVIEVRDVDMGFEDKILFEGLELTVREGEVLVILGFSGCGKSVLLKLMSGLMRPQEGEILHLGEDIADMDEASLVEMRKSMSYVFQNNALFDSQSVLENVAFGLLEHTKMGDAEIRERVLECLGYVGLHPDVLGYDILPRMPAELSGGMRKRVALARAVATHPRVILYDDPTGGLDPQSVTRIGDMMEKLQSDLNLTSVVVTGDMKIAFRVADRMALIHDHHVAHLGTPDYFRECDAPEVVEFVRDPEGRTVRY